MLSNTPNPDVDLQAIQVQTTTHTTPDIVSELISAYEELVADGEIEA